MSYRLWCISLLLLLLAFPAKALEPPDPKPMPPILSSGPSRPVPLGSIVPSNQQISDTRTKLFLARILGWIRDYEHSLALYQEILDDHPENYQTRREAARTAYWAKDNQLGDSLYRQLFTPPVDKLLARRLAKAAKREKNRELIPILRKLSPQNPTSTIFKDYESLERRLQDQNSPIPAQIQEQVQDVLYDLKPEYVLHKQAWLEYKAKQAMWNKRFIPAMHDLQALVRFEPENQEARFDLAQTQCVLGLCDQEADTYTRLLDLEPKHNLARRALKRQKSRSSPALTTGYSLWEEEGRGELSQMRRQRSDMNLDVPFFCRHGLGLSYSRYWENPKRHSGSVAANSLGLQGRATLNAFWSGNFAVQVKDYLDNEYERQETGHLGLRLNAWDVVRFRFRFKRQSILPNAFALEQGIYEDTWRIGVASAVTHALSATIGGEYADYSDDNSGVQADAAVGYALTEHPREIKITVSGEYRHITNESQEIRTRQPDSEIQNNQGVVLTDISHPYWTPQDYLGTALTLEWRHDLSEFQFCGTRENIYDLQLIVGTDTESNPSLELKGTYSLDFAENWKLELEGMVHESRDWDARALHLGVKYRF